VQQIARKDVPLLSPEASLDDAMRRFGIYNVALLPVVASASSRTVLGAVTQQAVVQAYYRHTVLTMETHGRLEMASKHPQSREGFFREIVLPESWPRHLRLSDIGRVLPRGTVVVAVSRGEDKLVARGGTELRDGDRVLLYGTEEGDLDTAGRLLTTGHIDPGTSAGLFQEVTISGNLDKRMVRDLSRILPSGVLLVSIRRAGGTIVPSGQTQLTPGDVVTLFAVDQDKLNTAAGVLSAEPPTVVGAPA